MTRIELSPFDKKDLLELLEYAKEMKQNNRPVLRGTNKWDDTEYWVMRIEQLKMVINGRIVNDSLYGSSLPEPQPNEYDTDTKNQRRIR